MIKNQAHPKKFLKLFFIGSIYENRKKIIKQITKQGIKISVNPLEHTMDEGGEHSLSYVDYLKTLKKYELALNLSTNSREKKYQLKSRVMELSILGCKFISDGMEYVTNLKFNTKLITDVYPMNTLKTRIKFLSYNEEKKYLSELSTQAIEYNNLFWKYLFIKTSI